MSKTEAVLFFLIGAMIVYAFREARQYDAKKLEVLSDLVIMQNDEYQGLRKKVEKLEKQMTAFNNALVVHDKDIMKLINKGEQNGIIYVEQSNK